MTSHFLGNVSIIRGFDNPISSIRVSRVSRVRVTLTVTVRVSIIIGLALWLVSGIALNKYRCE